MSTGLHAAMDCLELTVIGETADVPRTAAHKLGDLFLGEEQ